ncbi:MAG: ATPase, T2SS/T4P/T4SS family [Thermoleophilaceae bacterium]
MLVTGPTGSGKSTTLAAMIDLINRERHEHIMTVEDPIEFLHPHQNCIVNQRELGADAKSFAQALKAALRQDPDVILVGEMRDLETISHGADRGRDRPPRVRHPAHPGRRPDRRPHRRRLPARRSSTRCGCSSRWPSRASSPSSSSRRPTAAGAPCACEVLVPTPAVRNLIREGKTHQIYSTLQTGGAHGHADHGRRAGRRSSASARSPASSPRRARRRPRASLLGRPAWAPCSACGRRSAWPPSRSRPLDLAGRPDRAARWTPTTSRRWSPSSARKGLIVLDIEEQEPTSAGDLLARFKKVKAQRPDRDDAPALDDDLLGHVAAARALRARGADRERQAQGGARRRSASDVEAGISLSDALASATRTSSTSSTWRWSPPARPAASSRTRSTAWPTSSRRTTPCAAR